MKILIPTDFSEAAHNAIEYAAPFSRMFKAELVLLYVYKVPVISGVSAALAEDEINETRREIHKKFEALSNHICHQGVEKGCSFLSREGDAAKEIRKMIREKSIDLVIMGSKGGGALETFLFGSVTEAMIEEASCPVLIIPEEVGYKPLSRIVYASNFLDDDVFCLNELGAIAKPFGARIDVVNVSDDVDRIKWMKTFESAVRNKLTYSNIYFDTMPGTDVARAFEKYTERNNADLITINTRRRGYFQSLYNKSLAKKLSYQSELPLMVFHCGGADKDFV